MRTSIPKAATQLSTGVGEGIVLFPDTDFKLGLHKALGKGVYTVTNFGAVLNINLTMSLKARKKLPAEIVKIIDEVAVEWTLATAKALFQILRRCLHLSGQDHGETGTGF